MAQENEYRKRFSKMGTSLENFSQEDDLIFARELARHWSTNLRHISPEQRRNVISDLVSVMHIEPPPQDDRNLSIVYMSSQHHAFKTLAILDPGLAASHVHKLLGIGYSHISKEVTKLLSYVATHPDDTSISVVELVEKFTDILTTSHDTFTKLDAIKGLDTLGFRDEAIFFYTQLGNKRFRAWDINLEFFDLGEESVPALLGLIDAETNESLLALSALNLIRKKKLKSKREEVIEEWKQLDNLFGITDKVRSSNQPEWLIEDWL